MVSVSVCRTPSADCGSGVKKAYKPPDVFPLPNTNCWELPAASVRAIDLALYATSVRGPVRWNVTTVAVASA